jgi:hypothetical protein
MRFSSAALMMSLGALLMLPARVCAQATDASPFLAPHVAGAAEQAPDGSSYELRGIMSTDHGFRFCIFVPGKKASAWVELNEPGHSFTVKAADPKHDSVTLQTNDGRELALVLREAKVASLNPGYAQPPSVAMAPGMPPGLAPTSLGATNMVLNPTPEDNQRRLQAIADEVRRRRLLREQAQQQSQAPGAPRQP